MLGIQEYLNFPISRQAPARVRDGFGLGLIFGEHTNFAEDVVASYSSFSAVSDVFTSGDIYNAALVYFGQPRQPSALKVARRRANVAQTQLVTVVTAADDIDYTVIVNGDSITIDSGSSATTTTIATALFNAINIHAQAAVVTATDETTLVRITSDVAGLGFTLSETTGAGGSMTITHVVTGTVDTAVDSTDYWVYVGGTKYTYTSDTSATIIEIGDGLAALITVNPAVTAVGGGDGTYVITATAIDTVFDAFADSNQTLTTDKVNVSAATEIARIRGINSDWTFLMNVHRSTETQQLQDISQLAAYSQASSLDVFYCSSISQLSIPSVLATDIGSILQALNYDMSALTYRDQGLDEYAESAIAGVMLPEDAGAINMAWKPLTGITPDDLDLTTRTLIYNKGVNHYDSFASNQGALFDGVAPNGFKIHIAYGLMNLKFDLEVAAFAFFRNSLNVAYTDVDTAALKNVVWNELQRYVERGLFVDGSVVVTVGKVVDQSAANKAAFTYDGINWTAVLAGSIDKFTAAGTTQVAGSV